MFLEGSYLTRMTADAVIIYILVPDLLLRLGKVQVVAFKCWFAFEGKIFLSIELFKIPVELLMQKGDFYTGSS